MRSYKVKRAEGKPPDIELQVFQPKGEKEVPKGTVVRGNASCPACNTPLAVDRVRTQLRQQRGGADTFFGTRGNRSGGACLLAVVTLRKDQVGRQYRVATERDYVRVWKAQQAVAKLANKKLPNGISVIPDEALPPQGTLGFRVQLYGMTQWSDLFTARQKLALTTLASKVKAAADNSGVNDLLSLVVDRVASRSSSLCLWRYQADQEKVEHIFGRQALPAVWDFAESVITSESTGSFSDGLSVVARAVEFLTRDFARAGHVQLLDATTTPLPDDTGDVW